MSEPKVNVSVACQTEPNLIAKLINTSTKKPSDDIDLYQEYVRDAQCGQFWPLDKNPIRSIVPSMLKVDLPEQHLKNESLMFDLVQAIRNNSKLVNLLAKYLHHIVPNVIISKRIDLIPLITCTIRVCDDQNEQERLLGLLFNLIKRPNEEQRRMILSGLTVVLQVSPQHQSSTLLLPNLWDHVADKFPERRILLAESCATLAHYVRPVMRTNLILSILVQLLRDKNAAVRLAACKSFACLLTLIMDRNDEVFDACLSATEDILDDVLEQAPLRFCEHRFEVEEMRFCCVETIYPLICMWAVKLNRFKVDLAEFYLSKTEDYMKNQVTQESSDNLASYRAKMISYLIPFVFSDAVHGCAWLSKSRLSLPDANNNNTTSASQESSPNTDATKANNVQQSQQHQGFQIFDGPAKFQNKILDPTMIVDESAIIAFHDQLVQEHNIESMEWIINKFLPKLLDLIVAFSFSSKIYQSTTGLATAITSIRQLCLLFGKHFAKTKLRPYIKQLIASKQQDAPSLYIIYMASLTSFEPIEQLEFEEIFLMLRQNLSLSQLNRHEVETLALAIKIIATNENMIQSPSTRQKFLIYILDALKQTKTKEFLLIIFRHILSCIIDQTIRPTEWAQILVTKFLPILIMLANDSSDVHVCTYARLMCAQLVETFDNFLSGSTLTQQAADSIRPVLASLKILTEQIQSSNLRRQIECLSIALDEKASAGENPKLLRANTIN